jgi:hypothetical protein
MPGSVATALIWLQKLSMAPPARHAACGFEHHVGFNHDAGSRIERRFHASNLPQDICANRNRNVGSSSDIAP